MVNPKILCRKHLIAENVEAHMFVSTIKNGVSIQGYIDKNLLEPLSLVSRHDEIAAEMIARGYRHQSPIGNFDVAQYITNQNNLYKKVDKISAFRDLITRCKNCRNRFLWYVNNGYVEITSDIEDLF
jgi:hypothetical protein